MNDIKFIKKWRKRNKIINLFGKKVRYGDFIAIVQGLVVIFGFFIGVFFLFLFLNNALSAEGWLLNWMRQ